MVNKIPEFDFEFNLNFEGHKNPIDAFSQMAKMYERLVAIDKNILYNILPDAHIEYELADIEFSSIRSKVIQILKSVPDDVLKNITDPKKIIGLLLVYIKHRILKAVETNEVQSKIELEKVTSEINKKLNQISSPNIIILSVDNYFILNTINEIGKEGKRLKNSESYEYISEYGNARIKNNNSINMPKILYELGSQTFEQQRAETLKVKTLDLLSDRTKWKLIRQGKQIEVKILDKEWLDNYHDRNIDIKPNDYLKIDLKIIYTTDATSVKPIVYYEALKVLGVIPPEQIESNNQRDLFEQNGE
jgi:hypothetical protein